MGKDIKETKEADFYKRFQPIPIDRDISQMELLLFLATDEKMNLIPMYNWVYWKYGDANRLHRVCSRYFKKQKKDGSKWIKDTVV